MDIKELLSLGLDEATASKVIAISEIELGELGKRHEEEINSIRLDNFIEKALADAGARNVTACKALLNLDGISFDGDYTKGIDEQISKLKKEEKSSFLFEQRGFRGVKPKEGRDGSPVKDLNSMNYTELCRFMEENPDALK